MTRRLILLVALVTAFLTDARSAAQQLGPPVPAASDSLSVYFPLRPGLSWTYGGSPMETARILRVSAVADSSDRFEMVWDGLGGRRIVEIRPDGQVWERRGDQSRMLVDFAADAGDTWTIAPLEGTDDLLDGTTVVVSGRSKEIRTPYGVLEACVHLTMRPDPRIADAGVTEAWFAPGIGLARWVETTIAGPQTYELVQFGHVVGGDTDSTVVSPEPPLPEPAGRDKSAVDFDDDGRVDFPDFLLFARAYRSRVGTAGYRPAFDLNSDGIVSFGDFLVFARLYRE